MKKLLPASLLVLALFVSACSSQTGSTGSDESHSDNESAKTYSMNEVAIAGPGAYTVTFAEKMDSIPAANTLPDFESIAQDTPAAEGFMWVHVKGTLENLGKESTSLNSTSLHVQDEDGNVYKTATDTSIYVPSEKSPVYISVEPTQTVDWEAYFMVPKDAKGLVLYGNDLSYVPEAVIYIDLGL